MATAKYELLNDSMYYGGREYTRGDVVELDEERGAELVALGALQPAAAEKPARGRGKPDTAPTAES